MSSTTPASPDHIEESIAQIILTQLYERPMENLVGSDCNKVLFSPNDPAARATLKYAIADAITRLEPRVICTEDMVQIATLNNILVAKVTYKIKDYGDTHSQIIELGRSA